jgi:hypothetical protein
MGKRDMMTMSAQRRLWHEYATKGNSAQEKKGVDGVDGCMDVHVPKLSYSKMIYWGVTDYGLCSGYLNINIRVRGGKGKMKPVQALHLSRVESRALVKAKLVPHTVTAIGLANKTKSVKNGHCVASKAYEVTSTDGETVKGIAPTTLNACAHLNNLLKAQQLKKAYWVIIKESLEAGVPGMEAVATNFMKHQFALRYGTKAPVLAAGASSNA